ncbi:MAG: helix-turn-helix domain-containing protein [Actinobacteria bacterium]|nr:helix-turn-helix domain-containing protein [Actinomycetota bacterium]
MCDLPELMTVEEAARYLRIGRTEAYAMTRQWRTSGGRFGLPAVEIGNALRVSRPRLEELIAAALAAEEEPPGWRQVASDLDRPAERSTPAPATPAASPRTRTGTTSRRRHRDPRLGQPALFEPADQGPERR